MPFNAKLNERIRAELAQTPNVIEKKMFGGVGYMLNGNMCCGILGDELIARFEPAKTSEMLTKPHTRVFAARNGRPMSGWVMVHADGLATKAQLAKWVKLGVTYASALPEKIKN